MTDRELLEQLLAEVRELKLAVVGKGYRSQLIAELADVVGLGPTWVCAQTLALILTGARAAPEGQEATVTALRADGSCPRSARQLMRLLKARAKAVAADKSAALCQWPRSGNNQPQYLVEDDRDEA